MVPLEAEAEVGAATVLFRPGVELPGARPDPLASARPQPAVGRPPALGASVPAPTPAPRPTPQPRAVSATRSTAPARPALPVPTPTDESTLPPGAKPAAALPPPAAKRAEASPETVAVATVPMQLPPGLAAAEPRPEPAPPPRSPEPDARPSIPAAAVEHRPTGPAPAEHRPAVAAPPERGQPSRAAAAPDAAPVFAEPVPVQVPLPRPPLTPEELVYRREGALFALVLAASVLLWSALAAGAVAAALVSAPAALALACVPLALLVLLLGRSAMFASVQGTAVLISPRQFPDLHDRIARCAARLGLADVPDCYLLNGHGAFRTLTTRFLGRSVVVLLSDAVDALETRPAALDFHVGRELARVHRRHLAWRGVLLPGRLLPLLGAAYHRACESTCDRYGAACCSSTEDAVAALAVLAAGGRRFQGLRVDEYLAQARETGGFWMSFHELVSDQPWLVKRAARVAAFHEGGEPELPRRNPLAFLFALLVPRTTGGRAGIVGMLSVLAVVAVVTAFAMPALLRTRAAANEAATVREVQVVANAQFEFARTRRRFASLDCLAGRPACSGERASPPALDASLAATDLRHGYRFRLELDPDNPVAFAYTAAPVEPGRSGIRAFCTDGSGAVYAATSAADLTASRRRAACAEGLQPVR